MIKISGKITPKMRSKKLPYKNNFLGVKKNVDLVSFQVSVGSVPSFKRYTFYFINCHLT